MAIHNFNYSYAYVGVHTTPLSETDDTAIVTEVTVAVTAVDQADSSKTLTESFSKVFNPYPIKDNGTPEDFKAIEPEDRLNAIFTWKIFGPEEVDTIHGD